MFEVPVLDGPEPACVRWSAATMKSLIDLNRKPGLMGWVVFGDEAEQLGECSVTSEAETGTFMVVGKSRDQVKALLDEVVTDYLVS
jgi:hypothetical protein